jgi:hypothetical protein
MTPRPAKDGPRKKKSEGDRLDAEWRRTEKESGKSKRAKKAKWH